jgi:hypothetical protein
MRFRTSVVSLAVLVAAAALLTCMRQPDEPRRQGGVPAVNKNPGAYVKHETRMPIYMSECPCCGAEIPRQGGCCERGLPEALWITVRFTHTVANGGGVEEFSGPLLYYDTTVDGSRWRSEEFTFALRPCTFRFYFACRVCVAPEVCTHGTHNILLFITGVPEGSCGVSLFNITTHDFTCDPTYYRIVGTTTFSGGCNPFEGTNCNFGEGTLEVTITEMMP